MTKTWAMGFVVLVAICGVLVLFTDVINNTGGLLMAVGGLMFFWIVGGFLRDLAGK